MNRFLPFLRWFPIPLEALRGDLIAGITVALILIPQSMAYATLAGLPVVYGLYASFLPVMVASMWGASRFLHTGPVALLSLMSAAAIEPLARRGSDEFIALSMTSVTEQLVTKENHLPFDGEVAPLLIGKQDALLTKLRCE